ncbi:MAG: GFA family protein [Paracoccaceae bacterium]|nr:GFA family protein [Paracoccaceae bacterium]
MDRHEGGCLCGAIRYETEGAPLRVTICHCRYCQRATGAGFMINANFTQAAHRVTKGAPRVHDHRSEGSGKLLHVHFCPDCGTKLHMTFERAPGYVGIYVGTFDTPGWITFDPVTSKQIFLDSARPDAVILPAIRAFAAHETTNDGTRCVAHVFDAPVTVAAGWPPEQAMR